MARRLVSIRLLRAALLAAVLLASIGASAADAPTQVPGLIREAISVPFARHGAQPLQLEAMVTRPTAASRYPLIVLSHGAPRDPNDRAKTSPSSTSAIAIEFARRGWAVVAVVRRGYGRSQGAYAESSGACRDRHYLDSAHVSAQDVLETVKFMGHQAYVDPGRVMLVGVSAGGFASIAAAAARPPGLVAVLNFAGGRGSDAVDSVCDADKLVGAYGELGRIVRVPTLWLYAENDHFFGPALAQRFFTAFTKAGGTGSFVKLPAFGSDGHLLFTAAAMPLWRDRVDGFLRQNKLPTWSKPVIEAAAHLPPPWAMKGPSLEEFERYLASSNFEKALAIGADHHFTFVTGRRSAADASHDALADCTKRARNCKVYAINNALAR